MLTVGRNRQLLSNTVLYFEKREMDGVTDIYIKKKRENMIEDTEKADRVIIYSSLILNPITNPLPMKKFFIVQFLEEIRSTSCMKELGVQSKFNPVMGLPVP